MDLDRRKFIHVSGLATMAGALSSLGLDWSLTKAHAASVDISGA